MEGAARFVNDDDAEPLPVGVVVLMRGDEEHDIAFFILIAPFLPPPPWAPTRLGASASPARRKEGGACGIRPVVEVILPSPPTLMAAPLAGLCPLLRGEKRDKCQACAVLAQYNSDFSLPNGENNVCANDDLP